MGNEPVLSQDEVDALLKKTNDSKPTAEIHDIDYKKLDFTHQEKMLKNYLPALSRICDRMIKRMQNSLYDFLSHELAINIRDIGVVNYQDFMMTLKMPSAIKILRVNDLRGKTMLVMDTDLVSAMVDKYFGGNGRYQTTITEREFTATEKRIIDLATNILIEDLSHAWAAMLTTTYQEIDFEMDPQLAATRGANDVMLVLSFDLNLSGADGILSIVFPNTILDAMRDSSTLEKPENDAVDHNWVKALSEEMLDAQLEVSTVLCEKNISLRDIMTLNTDDIMPIEVPENMTVYVESIPVFKAKYALSNDKCTLKITERLKR